MRKIAAHQATGNDVPAVVDSECEHPVEPLDAVRAPLLKRVQQHLGIGMVGAPAVLAERLEFLADRRMVVDFAVERHGHGAGVVHHRLIRFGGQIDDRQTAVCQRAPPIGRAPDADAVRSAMRHAVAHQRDNFGTRAGSLCFERSDDTAHVNSTLAG